MTDREQTEIRQRVAAWSRAEPVLRRVREEDIRSARTVEAIASFRGLAAAAARRLPPTESSGLVEQQRWFRQLAEKS